MTDNYPLMDNSACYSLQAWWLNSDSKMYRDDRSKAQGSVTIANGGSHIWTADQATLMDINFSGEDTWTGQIVFTTAPLSSDNFTVEIGFWDGSDFTAGPSATITGDDNTTFFNYETSKSGFTVATGKYLALKITNGSGNDYDVQTGGAWSYCSSPQSSNEYPFPIELTSFTANVLSNGVELKWQTATEVNNYGFEILRSTQNDNINDNWTKLGFVNGNGNSNSPKNYSFVDEDIKNQANGKYYYRLKQINTDGSFVYSSTIEIDWTNGVTDVNDDNNNLPKEFSLSQNYPNPFNPTTKIKYTIPFTVNVETHYNVSQQNGVSVQLKIYNIMGQKIATLVNEEKTPGEYEVEFNGKGLSSGMYFYKIEAGNFVQVRKMIMMK